MAGWLCNGVKTCASSEGPSLQAQPAPWLYFVSWIMRANASAVWTTVRQVRQTSCDMAFLWAGCTVSTVEPRDRIDAIASALSIPTVERHIVLCADQTTPKCAPASESNEVWRHLKSRLKALGVTSAPPPWHGITSVEAAPVEPGGGTVLRTKADCLRVCEMGPIAVVYPDGVWYHSVTIEVMDRIIDEHLVGGVPVSEFVFARSGRES